MKTNDFFELNATGSRFWQLLEEGCDLPRIRDRMCEEYDVEPTELEGEIDGLLETLLDRGLCQLQSTGAESDLGAPVPSPVVIAQEAGEGMILANMKSNVFYELNSTGSRFWQLLQQGLDLSRIREVMSAEFDVRPEQLDAEIDALVDDLIAQGLCTYATAD